MGTSKISVLYLLKDYAIELKTYLITRKKLFTEQDIYEHK